MPVAKEEIGGYQRTFAARGNRDTHLGTETKRREDRRRRDVKVDAILNRKSAIRS